MEGTGGLDAGSSGMRVTPPRPITTKLLDERPSWSVHLSCNRVEACSSPAGRVTRPALKSSSGTATSTVPAVPGRRRTPAGASWTSGALDAYEPVVTLLRAVLRLRRS